MESPRSRLCLGGFALVSATLLGCTSPPRAAPAPEVDVAERQDAPTPAIPSAAPPPQRPEVASVDIGWPARPRISRRARELNREALVDHRAERFDASRDGFAAALAESPDHDMARYNLACALSRLGDLDAAQRELLTVLHRDLRRFQMRWRGPEADADLEALRGSPRAAAIDARLPGLRAAYERAHDDGIPGYFYRHKRRYVGLPPGASDDDYERIDEYGGTTQLLAGIYLHEAKRFVPLTRDTDVAQLDLPNRRALHMSTGIWEGMSHGMMHAEPTAYFISTSPDPAKAFAAKLTVDPATLGIKVDEREMAGVGFVTSLTVGWQAQGVAFDLQHWAGYDDKRRAWRLEPDGTRTDLPRPVDFDLGFELRREGAVFIAPKPEGLRLVAKTLEIDGREPIRLDRKYDDVFVGPDRKFALVVQQRHFTNYDDWSDVNDATVTRVNLTTGKLERLAQGEGAGWVVIDPEGALYVETGGTTQRWPSIHATTPGETIPDLHLTMPRDPAFCENCG